MNEPQGLTELRELRARLHEELRHLASLPNYLDGQTADECCRHDRNQMRITPLEAKAIVEAFRTNKRLKAHLVQVIQRLRTELRHLKDNDSRQNFNCPLLENGLCLVHQEAKPIGCLAWHPHVENPQTEAPHFTELGWESFEYRDSLNDAVYGAEWKARVIPLWLRRVFSQELARSPVGE